MRRRSQPNFHKTFGLQQLPYTLGFSEADCNPQLQSPLFTKLPAEIRNAIFDLVVVQEEDLSKPYSQEAYYYRPGYRAKLRMNTELLRACRKVYQETKVLPAARYTEHTIWGGSPLRAPPGVSVDPGYRSGEYMPGRLLPASGVHIEHMRFFTQMYWLEEGSLQVRWKAAEYFNPKKISIVIRHSDWWDWELDHPLVMKNHWVPQYECPNTVEEIEMVFETVERKKTQLDDILQQQIKHWKFRRQDGTELLTDAGNFTVSRWAGSRKINGSYHSERQGFGLDMLLYYVVKATWRLPHVAGKLIRADNRQTTWLWKPADESRKKH